MWDYFDHLKRGFNRVKPKAMFITGLISLGLSIVVLAFTYFASSAPEGVERLVPPPVSDRVRSVVLIWSKAPSISDTDKLETIWGETRNSGQHDYDFSPGGIYDLESLLILEFGKSPTRTVPPLASFGSAGKIKTFGDLVDAIQ
jgi:hypothetical protein